MLNRRVFFCSWHLFTILISKAISQTIFWVKKITVKKEQNKKRKKIMLVQIRQKLSKCTNGNLENCKKIMVSIKVRFNAVKTWNELK